MSPAISPDRRQLTLSLEPGLTQRYRCVRDVVAQGVYKRGLKASAADLDMAPGNLSVALSDEGVRHFSVDALERYIQTSGDLTPVYYLVERYLGDASANQAQAVGAVTELLQQLPELLAAAGLAPQQGRGRR